jgi:RNA polymerase sigma-70 factor (ECF subfamily)
MARKPVTGRSRMARFIAWVVRRYAADPRFADVRLTVAEVNGQPAVLAWSRDSLRAVLILEVDGTAIMALWLVAAPAKLAVAARQAVGVHREDGLP